MATLDEIFAAMPDAPVGGTHELLIIDPDTRQIEVPEIESTFGVVTDGNAEKKYFQCPRYVGKGIDLAACKLRIAYQNASNTEEGRDGYLVQDLTESGGYVYFSWELSSKVCLYQGTVQFAVCAMLGSTVVWNTTIATGAVLDGLTYNGEIAQTEMQDVIAQLLALVEAQSAAVEAAGAAQVKNVQAAGAAAVVEINAAAANAATAIVCEAEGATIQVANASDRPLQGLRIFGRSTQDGTPSPDNPVEIVSTPAPVVTVCGKNLFTPTIEEITRAGVTITQTPDGNFTVNGTKNGALWAEIGTAILTEGETYTLSANENLNIQIWDKVSDTSLIGKADGTTARKFTPKNTGKHLFCLSGSNDTPTYDNVLADIMVCVGENAAPWEPYTGQILTVANDLPGIPVASGGNYTDADGQQWICDEVDLSRGVYVQRVGIIALDGSKIPSVFATGNNGGSVFAYSYDELGIKIMQNRSNKLCNRLQGPTAVNPKSYKDCEIGRWGFNSDGSNDAFLVMNMGTFETVEVAAAWLAEHPAEFVYILSPPVETALTDAELAAFAALHSVKPTTILNGSGAHMTVEYVADTRLYIDSKLAELVAAMNA